MKGSRNIMLRILSKVTKTQKEKYYMFLIHGFLFQIFNYKHTTLSNLKKKNGKIKRNNVGNTREENSRYR